MTRDFEVIDVPFRHIYHSALALVLIPNNNTASADPARSRNTENFVLDFHPVRPLAAIARRKDSTVTILDLTSGLPYLTVNTGVEVHGLGIVENAIVVVGNGKVVTWNLPEGDRLPDAGIGTQDRAHSVYLSDDWQSEVIAASVSPDLSHVALVTQTVINEGRRLYLYCASKGRRVACVATGGNTLWFSPDGSTVWCAVGNEAEGWAVGRDSLCYEGSHAVANKYLLCPWVTFHSHKVMKDGWILGPDGRRLLMLPPRWLGDLDAVRWVWRGEHLALLSDTLSELVILELKP